VEPFFHTMGEVMERQPEIPPARLSQEQLRLLSMRIQNALSVLEKAGIPATLGHMDFNPGNIVVSPRRSVFLDWAEAFVGHPLLTFEYLLEHLRGSFGQDSSHREQLAACYLSPWRELLSERGIEDALEVTSLVAAFACAVGNDRWTNPKRLAEPRTAGYLRSLTRRMDREAHRLLERSALAQID
jgi:aminoglycoside phosphotransferase (APT) family kinase protein